MVQKSITKKSKVVKTEKICTVPLKEMIERMANEPKQKMIYSGIKENSVGFIFGPSKSGKTTYCENLGMSIAAGLDSYLGRPIQSDNKKVLFISLEEFCGGRTERNTSQIKKITELLGNDDWISNYIVADCNIPRYIMDDSDWQVIRKQIETHKPGIVFLDSLSRLHGINGIEDSVVAMAVMKKLRELSNDMNITIAVIHHTPKMLANAPLNLFAMAGSRVLAQDADFIIGINKTQDKKVYISDVAFRYASNDSEQVALVKMEANQWLTLQGYEDEAKLLSAFDGRRDNSNKDAIFQFIQEHSSVNDGLVGGNEITTAFTVKMSKTTVYNHLGALVKAGKILKDADTGQYKLAA